LNKSWYSHCQQVRFCLHVPTDKGYTKIYSNQYAFAALKADGSIKAWGDPDFGGENAPTEKGYTKIYSKSLHEFLKSPHAVIDPLAFTMIGQLELLSNDLLQKHHIKIM
jgi:hypothetical protein